MQLHTLSHVLPKVNHTIRDTLSLAFYPATLYLALCQFTKLMSFLMSKTLCWVIRKHT